MELDDFQYMEVIYNVKFIHFYEGRLVCGKWGSVL